MESATRIDHCPRPIDVRGPCLEGLAAIQVSNKHGSSFGGSSCLLFSAHLLTKPHQVFWWSYISADFATSLPSCSSSSSSSTIPDVVHHFSKMAHCVPLSNLPSAKDRAQPDSSLHPTASLGPWSARPLLPTPRLMDQLIRPDICYAHIEDGIWWTGRGTGPEGRSWIPTHHILSNCRLQVAKS